MSRKKREWYPGATYHVMSRGNRRTSLFKESSDYLCFLECIKRSKEAYMEGKLLCDIDSVYWDMLQNYICL